MKQLLLNGHGINFHVDGARLFVKDGFWTTKEDSQEYVFTPKRIPYNNIVIYGHSGNITLEAIKWLMHHNVGITILNWEGKLLTHIQPRILANSKYRLAQYQAYNSKEQTLEISRRIIKGNLP